MKEGLMKKNKVKMKERKWNNCAQSQMKVGEKKGRMKQENER